MADNNSNQGLLERYELLKGAEHDKNTFIEVSRNRRFFFMATSSSSK